MAAEIKTITVNGVTLAYREYGSGDKYLLSTQNFFFSGCHMALLGQEPYNYHVFLIYMRGYGESDHIFDPVPRDYTTIWGEDVVAFAQAMGIPSFYYTGISHGNWAGWHISFHHPELLRGFACCDGVVFRRSDPPRGPGIEQVDPSELAGNKTLLSQRAWREDWPTRNPARLARRSANHLEHLEILMRRKPEEFMVYNNNFSVISTETQEEYDERMAAIPVPVLLINGGKDPLSTAEAVLKAALLIPGARMLLYQHLGHGGPDECPEIIARDCDRFFRDTEHEIL